MHPISPGGDGNPGLLARVAAAYGALPEVRAVAVAGSRQAGTADEHSDLDLYVYASAPVPLAARREIADRFAATAEIGNTFWEPGDEWEDRTTGAAIDVIFRDPAWIEGELDRVLIRHEASVGYSTCLWFNVLHAEPLVDPRGWYRELQRRANVPYPAPLRRAIVARNHPILRQTRSSYRRQIELALLRDDRISLQHRMTALLASYFDVLFALNELPHPGEKRLVPYVMAHCDQRPADFDRRLHGLLAAAQTPAVLGHLDPLLDDLDALLAANHLID
jgi:hypothetical protein